MLINTEGEIGRPIFATYQNLSVQISASKTMLNSVFAFCSEKAYQDRSDQSVLTKLMPCARYFVPIYLAPGSVGSTQASMPNPSAEAQLCSCSLSHAFDSARFAQISGFTNFGPQIEVLEKQVSSRTGFKHGAQPKHDIQASAMATQVRCMPKRDAQRVVNEVCNALHFEGRVE